MGKPSRKYQNKKHGRKTQRKYKKKGGYIRKEKITLLFEKQHTSPCLYQTNDSNQYY